MTKQEFALRLAKLRVAKGVSARDMSLSLGQNPGYIYNIEAGRSKPSIEGLFFICEYLGITPCEFFDDGNNDPEKLNEIIKDLKRLNAQQLNTISALIKELGKNQKERL